MKLIKLFVIVIFSILLAHTAMAAFTTSNNDDSKNKYSLKHLNKLTNSYLSFQAKFRSLQNANTYFYSRQTNGLNISSSISNNAFSRPNTNTFIYPYKYTVKVPKFKTPTRPQQ